MKQPSQTPNVMVLLSQQAPNSSIRRFQIGTNQAAALYLQGRWMRCATKMVTSMLVMRLLEMGRLGCETSGFIRSLDEPILPPLRLSGRFGFGTGTGTQWANVTLREVMAGVALLPRWHYLPAWATETRAKGGSAEIAERSLAAAAQLAAADTTASAPKIGKHFQYSNMQWALVERLVEASTGLSYPRAARDFLFRPAGISRDTYFFGETLEGSRAHKKPFCPQTPASRNYERNLRAALGLCATPEDLFRLASVLTSGGTTHHTQTRILSPASITEILRDQLRDYFPDALDSFLNNPPVSTFRTKTTDARSHFVGRSFSGYHMRGREAKDSGSSWLVSHGGAEGAWGQRVVIRVDAKQSASGPLLVQKVVSTSPRGSDALVKRFHAFAELVSLNFSCGSTLEDLFSASGAMCAHPIEDGTLSSVVSMASLDDPSHSLERLNHSQCLSKMHNAPFETYSDIARRAEAIAAAKMNAEYFARVSKAAQESLWSDRAWVDKVDQAARPRSSLPASVYSTYRKMRLSLMSRSRHSLVSKASIKSLSRCAELSHDDARACGGDRQPLKCTVKQLLATHRCSNDSRCRRCACDYISKCNFGATGHVSFSRHKRCMPLYAAASVVCAASEAWTVVDRLLLLGLAYDVMHGDDDASNGSSLDLRLPELRNRIAHLLFQYSDNRFDLQHTPRRTTSPLACPKHLKLAEQPFRSDDIAKLEPLYPDGRNLFLRETGELISFVPYLPLPAIQAFHRSDSATYGVSATQPAHHKRGRTVLVDVGANDFYASPKRLIDMYAPHLPFTDVLLIEPAGRLEVPPRYMQMMRIHVEKKFIDVGTRNFNDLIVWLQENVTKEDYVVLKFDVDQNTNSGTTIEWGFLSDLYHAVELELIDELYIELHFMFGASQRALFENTSIFGSCTPGMRECWDWNHTDHSMAQQFDLLREIRRCGIAVHAWP